MFRKVILIITSSFLILSTLFVSHIYTTQEKELFRGEPLDLNYQFSSPYAFNELFFTAKDGATIHALLYHTDKPSKGIVLYFHGRGGNLSGYWNTASQDLLEKGYDVLMMDYRTFGKSQGKLSQKNLLTDAEMIYEYASSHYQPKTIVLYGRSLGSGIATYIASKYPAKILILEAPYSSILNMAFHKFSFLPKQLIKWCVKYPLRTDKWIRKVKVPIEIFHGRQDSLIPYEHSQLLLSHAKKAQYARLNTLDEGAHDGLSEYSEYQARLNKILN